MPSEKPQVKLSQEEQAKLAREIIHHNREKNEIEKARILESARSAESAERVAIADIGFREKWMNNDYVIKKRLSWIIPSFVLFIFVSLLVFSGIMSKDGQQTLDRVLGAIETLMKALIIYGFGYFVGSRKSKHPPEDPPQ